MLTDEEVYTEITNSQKGSDIHGLVEKISYHLHLRDNENSPEHNWHMAEDFLVRWSDSPFREELRKGNSFVSHIVRMLEHKAYTNHSYREFFTLPQDSFRDWIDAQDELAKQVLWQSSRISI